GVSTTATSGCGRESRLTAAQVFLVHGIHLWLSGFGHRLHSRAEDERRAESGVHVTIADALPKNRKSRLSGAMDRRDPLDLPGVMQHRSDAADLLVFRRQQM